MHNKSPFRYSLNVQIRSSGRIYTDVLEWEKELSSAKLLMILKNWTTSLLTKWYIQKSKTTYEFHVCTTAEEEYMEVFRFAPNTAKDIIEEYLDAWAFEHVDAWYANVS